MQRSTSSSRPDTFRTWSGRPRSTPPSVHSLRLCGERVAGIDTSRGQPAAEPSHALLRGAVGEGLGDHPALRLMLEPIVADCRGGAKAFFRVAWIEQVAARGIMAPHTREAIGLKLLAHRQGIGFRRGGA